MNINCFFWSSDIKFPFKFVKFLVKNVTGHNQLIRRICKVLDMMYYDLWNVSFYIWLYVGFFSFWIDCYSSFFNVRPYFFILFILCISGWFSVTLLYCIELLTIINVRSNEISWDHVISFMITAHTLIPNFSWKLGGLIPWRISIFPNMPVM